MKLVWTDPSIEDLRSIRDYIARDSEYYAATLIEQLILAAERLAEFPRLGRMVPEAHKENIREWCCENYRIIYRIAGECIEILTVVHGSRERTGRQPPG
ncbi:MAG TPA: type II toxin-antitoxin system RelE/ParE family toxin [Terriglobia bacterium]|nr:type II toxin-antitoxin system RelE/ParE family toxin [Terriglobia bacterium]